MDRPRVIARVPATSTQVEGFTASEDGLCNGHLMAAVRLLGPFEHAALEQALAALLERHEALRTTLQRTADGVEQWIWEGVQCPVVHVDGTEATLDDDVAAFADEGIRPAGSALCTVRVFRLGPLDHVVAIRLHHSISDGWSCGVVSAEFCALYEAAAARRPSPLKPLTAQFRDYAAQERAAATPEARAFWRDYLSPRSSRIGSVVGRPALERRPVLNVALPPIPAATMEALGRIASDVRAWPSSALLAAVAARALAMGDDDMVAGVAHSNRYRAEHNDVVGFFADLLTVRVDLTGAPTFRALAARVQQSWFDVFDHRMALSDVMDAAGLGREDELSFMDLSFNFIPRAFAREATPEASGGEPSALRVQPVHLNLEKREELVARRTLLCSWSVLFVEGRDGVLYGFVSAQEGSPSAERIAELCTPLFDTIAAVVAQPDIPLPELLGR